MDTSTVIDTLITTHRAGEAYGVSDLDRVAEAVEYINTRLAACGIDTITVTAKQDWAREDEPSIEQATAYLADISAMRGALAVYQSTPAVPGDMHKLTAQEANDIEKILIDVDKLITKMLRTINLGWALGVADIGIYGGLT